MTVAAATLFDSTQVILASNGPATGQGRSFESVAEPEDLAMPPFVMVCIAILPKRILVRRHAD